VLLGVTADVLVPLCVGVGLEVEEGVGEAVVDEDDETLGVLEGKAPNVKEEVGDTVSEKVRFKLLVTLI